jgi:hypothetical protein
LKSVAFPLIGCGVFGLDEKMLILQFLDALETLDNRLAEGESLHVWLVIRDRAQFESAAGVFLNLLLQERSKMAMVRVRPSGVPILDVLPLAYRSAPTRTGQSGCCAATPKSPPN